MMPSANEQSDLNGHWRCIAIDGKHQNAPLPALNKGRHYEYTESANATTPEKGFSGVRVMVEPHPTTADCRCCSFQESALHKPKKVQRYSA